MPNMYFVLFSKRTLLALLLLCGLGTPVRCQIGIDILIPDSSSVLDIHSTTKGLLIPRLTSGQRATLGSDSPGNSLLVFDTDANRFFYYSTTFSKWLSLPALNDDKLGVGVVAPQERLEVAGNVKADKFIGDGVIPAGGIIMWSGSVSTIPAGWALCNGQNGTPDLQSRFIIGAGPAPYTAGTTGGSAAVTLSVNQLPAHKHPPGTLNIISGGQHVHTTDAPAKDTRIVGINTGKNGESAQKPDAIGAVTTDGEGTHTHASADFAGETGPAGAGTAINIIPPYYALAFIIKL
jgi:microcystin-dependent protein